MLSINWFLFYILRVVCTKTIHLTQQEKNIQMYHVHSDKQKTKQEMITRGDRN